MVYCARGETHVDVGGVLRAWVPLPEDNDGNPGVGILHDAELMPNVRAVALALTVTGNQHRPNARLTLGSPTQHKTACIPRANWHALGHAVPPCLQIWTPFGPGVQLDARHCDLGGFAHFDCVATMYSTVPLDNDQGPAVHVAVDDDNDSDEDDW